MIGHRLSLISLFLAGILLSWQQEMVSAAIRGERRNLKNNKGSDNKKKNKSSDEKKKKKKTPKGGVNGYLSAVDQCRILQAFNLLGRHENNDRDLPGLNWDTLCDDTESLDVFLCPHPDTVQNEICSHRRPYLNPAVKQYYCQPLAEELEKALTKDNTYFYSEEDYKLGEEAMIAKAVADCLRDCTNYVASPRGACCDLTCL
jgi:hypothetical protein